MTEGETFERLAHEVQFMFSVVHRLGFQVMTQHLMTYGNGVSPLQFGMMCMLSTGRMTLSELSRKLQLDPSTLVPSINSLEQRGLITRVRDPNDRRRQPLELTEDGDKLLRSVPRQADNDPLKESLKNMGEEKRQQLITLMRELINHMPDGETTLGDIQERVAFFQQRAKNV